MDRLIAKADEVAATKFETSNVVYIDMRGPGIQKAAFMEWATSCLQAIKLCLGTGSDHYVRMNSFVSRFDGHFSTFEYCVGILKAARDDLAGGYILSISDLAAAEVFEDLISMAEYLRAQKHHLSAVAVAGAVLEDSLRKLCAQHGVTWQYPSSISKLNGELHKAQVYAPPTHGEIEAWGRLRNYVDHHNFTSPTDVDPDEVKRMIEGVRSFISKHLT